MSIAEEEMDDPVPEVFPDAPNQECPTRITNILEGVHLQLMATALPNLAVMTSTACPAPGELEITVSLKGYPSSVSLLESVHDNEVIIKFYRFVNPHAVDEAEDLEFQVTRVDDEDPEYEALRIWTWLTTGQVDDTE